MIEFKSLVSIPDEAEFPGDMPENSIAAWDAFVSYYMDPNNNFPDPFYSLTTDGFHPVGDLEFNRVYIGYAVTNFFGSAMLTGEAEAVAFRASAKALELSRPIEDFSEFERLATTFAQKTDPRDFPKDTVVMGVIDDGIAIANSRFQDCDCKSRVQHFWDMDGRPAGQDKLSVRSEISKDGRGGIDDLLVKSTAGGRVDEEKFYRLANLRRNKMGFTDIGRRRIAHGTHVLDTAAGHSPADDRTDRPIVAVQFPREQVKDSSGLNLGAHLCIAASYIGLRAEGMTTPDGKNAPVVMNISYGNYASAHDGGSLPERYLDALIKRYEDLLKICFRVVFSAGNGHVSQCHARVPAQVGRTTATETLTWRVHPDDLTNSRLQIWMPYEGFPFEKERVVIKVTSPGGVTSKEVHDNGFVTMRQFVVRAPDDPVGQLTYRWDWSSWRGVFDLLLQPTKYRADDKLRNLVAPFGLWKIEIAVTTSLPGLEPLRIWVQRDDRIPGYPPGGRQSYFEHPLLRTVIGNQTPEDIPVPDDCPIKHERMVNALATGEHVIVAGSFEQHGLAVLPFSAGGQVESRGGGPLDLKPDATIKSADGFLHRGLPGTGPKSGA
ncbi:MAG: S8 family serine peptidase, partial [Rhodobacter sp.]|nr:S8 family serine peptidase [Rhodobacter sp.]